MESNMILTEQDIHVGLVYKYMSTPDIMTPYVIIKVNREDIRPTLEVLNLSYLETVNHINLEDLLFDLNNDNKVVLYTQK